MLIAHEKNKNSFMCCLIFIIYLSNNGKLSKLTARFMIESAASEVFRVAFEVMEKKVISNHTKLQQNF